MKRYHLFLGHNDIDIDQQKNEVILAIGPQGQLWIPREETTKGM